jgi:hypothetical protein
MFDISINNYILFVSNFVKPENNGQIIYNVELLCIQLAIVIYF